MFEKQRTIAKAISFSGTGLHSGLKVNMTVNPASENHGIKFKRIDLAEQPEIAAIAESVTDTSRGTTISCKDVKVSTIEHIMAALTCCGIDNALIEINAPEAPIMDGSASQYAKDILATGTVEQNADRNVFVVTEKISFSIPESGVEIVAYPDDKFSANVNVDFSSKVVGKQYAAINSLEEAQTEILPCRTFVFLHELKPLIDNNLIKGGDLDNAIVIVEKQLPREEIDKLSQIFNKEGIKVADNGYLNNIELRYDNEIARHKMLDLIGDLALSGVHIKGKIFAIRPGHKANTEFAKILRKHIKAAASKPYIKYNPNDTPLYDINKIKQILPHRPPFLLVDKVIYLDATRVVGIKNVTMNEPFFVGHFPNEPVMPGVLQVEAIAQCGGILALSTVPDPEHYSTYFMKIEEVKFKRMVLPGDTLQFELELREPIRRGIVLMTGRAFVGDTLVTEAVLMAQIVRNRNFDN